MVPPDLRPETILRVLDEHGVAYVLIGGLAAVAQGSPIPTEDVDITPERSQENLTRLSAALRALDARVRTPDVEEGLPFGHDAVSLAGSVFWNLRTRYGDVDISFVPAGTQGYEDLVRAALPTDLYGVTVQIAALADVVRSKQAANRPKDQRALPVLREILARRKR